MTVLVFILVVMASIFAFYIMMLLLNGACNAGSDVMSSLDNVCDAFCEWVWIQIKKTYKKLTMKQRK